MRIVDVRNFFIKKRYHLPHEAALSLALFAQEQEVVLRQDGDIQLGDDGVVISDDAWKKLLTGLQLGEEIVVNLLLDSFGLPAAIAKLRERRRPDGRRGRHYGTR
jgi:hypothetical protein